MVQFKIMESIGKQLIFGTRVGLAAGLAVADAEARAGHLRRGYGDQGYQGQGYGDQRSLR